MENSRDFRLLVNSVRVVSHAARHPGEANDLRVTVAEAERYLEALNGLELVEAIIELRTKSPGGGFPEIFA